MKVLFKEFITVWTRGLVQWLSRKFDSISIDFTPVEEKLDEVKSDVADVKTAVENINVESADALAAFFGLPEALPGSYTALTQAEVIASTRAEQVNAWGEDGCPIPDYLPTGVTEAMVEAAATALGITYYEPNFNIATL